MREATRTRLARDVDAFLAHGGRVKHYPAGMTSDHETLDSVRQALAVGVNGREVDRRVTFRRKRKQHTPGHLELIRPPEYRDRLKLRSKAEVIEGIRAERERIEQLQADAVEWQRQVELYGSSDDA